MQETEWKMTETASKVSAILLSKLATKASAFIILSFLRCY